MQNVRNFFFVIVWLFSISTYSQDIKENFKNLPSEYRPQIFWDWMHDMVTKEGITSDLESFKKFGLSGTLIMIIGEADAQFNPGHGIKNPIKPMSPEFFDAWKFVEEYTPLVESGLIGPVTIKFITN